ELLLLPLQRQQDNVIGTAFYLSTVKAIIITTYVPVLIQQNELLRVDKVILHIGRAGRKAQFISGIIVNSVLIACQEPPMIMISAKAVGISTQYRHRVMSRINADGHQLHNGIKRGFFLRVFSECTLQQTHIACQPRANIGASGKEKVYNEKFIRKIF